MVLAQVREHERVEADAVEPAQRAPCERRLDRRARSPASSISRKSRWRSIASGVVNGAGRRSPPTLHSTVPTSPARRPRPRASRAAGTPSSSCRSSRSRRRARAPSSARRRTRRPRRPSQLARRGRRAAARRRRAPLDDERGRPALDRLPREVVPVDALAANAEEQRARRDAARVVREIADLDRPASDHLARGERPDQRLELHAREARETAGGGSAVRTSRSSARPAGPRGTGG